MKKAGILLFLILIIHQTAFSQNALSQNALSAEELMNTAFTKAKKENKNIYVIFTASWCTPCNFLKYFISDIYNKAYFENNYVFVELHNSEHGEKKILNNSGTRNMLMKYHGDTTEIPYQLILNADGKKIADYLGAPVNPEEVPGFIKLLKRTSRLKDSELKMISERIRQLSKNSESY